MTDEADSTNGPEPEPEAATETEAVTETDTETAEDVVVDLDSAAAYDQRIDELQDTVAEQAEQIEELEDLLVDLSVRAADDRGMGVCPECHGPVEKVSRWFGPTTIECRRCGNTFHEY